MFLRFRRYNYKILEANLAPKIFALNYCNFYQEWWGVFVGGGEGVHPTLKLNQ